jgi:hypothetical protein
MLILLEDTRRKLLWLWLAGAVLAGLLTFVRTQTGMYEDMEAVAWSWYFTHILPTLLLLFVAVIGNRNPSKVVRRSTFFLLYAGGLSYLLLVALTLFGRPDTIQGQSMEDYLRLSYSWLLPFQALLLALFGIFYFRKEPFFQPNAAIVQAYVGKKTEYAHRHGSLLQIQAFDTLIQPDGLARTLAMLAESPGTQKNDLILLQSQYANWTKGRDLNLAAPDQLQRELNRMTLAVIDIIENLSV